MEDLQSKPKTCLTPEDLHEVKAVVNVPSRREENLTWSVDVIRLQKTLL